MNIVQFGQALEAVIRQNVEIALKGGSVRDYLVPMAWGDPGLGKTEMTEDVASRLEDLGRDIGGGADEGEGWSVAYADLATRDPAELGGLPWIKDGRAIRCRPDWLPTSGRGLLFLDEIPQSGLANLNIAATLIRDHRIGEHELPRGWMIVCAGNYPHNKAGTTALPSHVQNRLLHWDVRPDANAWAKWAARKGVKPMLIAYNRFRAHEFHHKFSATERAYPTGRSWTMANKVLDLNLPRDLLDESLAGTVGSAAHADYKAFETLYSSLPDIDRIIREPDFGEIPQNTMTAFALMGALASRATRTNFAAIVRYLDRLPEQDFAVACVVDATERDSTLTSTSIYQSWAARNGALLTAA